MAHEYRRARRVEFAETDMAGIVHFSVYYRYMEETEHEFLRSLGLSVHHEVKPGQVVGFPRVSTRCEYFRPIRFEEECEIHLWVSRKARKSLEYSCRISVDGQPVAQGQMVVIACQVEPGEGTHMKIQAVPLPDRMDAALEVAPYPPLEFRSDSKGAGS